MNQVVCIVEGHGEVEALPILLRRIALERFTHTVFRVDRPIRVKRDRFINRPEELDRYLALAGLQCAENDLVLVLLDADDECPAELGAQLAQRAMLALPHRRIAIVLANREFEAWFIAAATSLYGTRGLTVDRNDHINDPEIPRDAKGWLSQRMPGGYGEVLDQPAFAARMELEQAFVLCRSFRKLCKELESWLAAQNA